jgi:hypothetical protein
MAVVSSSLVDRVASDSAARVTGAVVVVVACSTGSVAAVAASATLASVALMIKVEFTYVHPHKPPFSGEEESCAPPWSPCGATA